MATINLTNLAQSAGVPSQWEDQILPVPEGLICGETPAVVVTDQTMAANTTIAAYTPVGFDDSGNLVEAVRDSVDPADDVAPIGITLKDHATGGTVEGVPILRAGCLNRDLINWPASFDTDAEKLAAFEGAPSPTSIVVRKVYLGATVAQP